MIRKHIRNLIIRANFTREYFEVKSLDNKHKLLGFQQKYLKDLLLHAYHNVPYYNEILKKIGIVKDKEVDLTRFSETPILTKNVIRQHQKELISKDYKMRKWYYNSSGGSTGEPVRFIQDAVYGLWGNVAFFYYYNDILGIDEPNVKKVLLWGSEMDIFQGGMGWRSKFRNWLSNIIFLNSFMMTRQDIQRYIEIINSYKPDLIRGYASSLYELCLYADHRGIRMHTPKAVVSSAETLRDDMRNEIEKVFGTKVYNFYGSREANNLAGECREGLMHILSFHNYIEILNNANQPVKENEEGRVIVTNLHNYSMPFIRYEIGDMAILGPEECKCGNPLPTLKKITGRITDNFIKADGTLIHGEYFTHLFYLKDWVKAFQIIQEDYSKIRILVALREKIKSSEKEDIENKIKLVMGQNCQIIWEFVDEIPKTPSGKYLYTKSLVRR